ncbi:MAG TPA: pyridoxine 5'-phosphate synthase [Longimicrobiales bacterium]|nr:pyridoxine 5'-phosphate synthase [Longimicrobiales bacterium]
MRLHINIDHVATVRQARRTDEPDPVRAAVLAELGGADGITVHLREDRRHIQDRDVRLLMETVRTGVNLELAVSPSMTSMGADLRPMTVTLVPEQREEITTEGGLDLASENSVGRVRDAVLLLREAGVRTSLFIDPSRADVSTAVAIGANAVELHTGAWAHQWQGARSLPGAADELARLASAAAHGASLGLAVHAGHGLTYENVAPVAAIEDIEELNIGHSVVSRAVLVGMERAVAEMKDLILRSRH